MNIRKQLRAFTLIELLIVITIIGILAVALVPRITGGPAKARDAARKADLQQYATALEFYADDNSGAYPTSDDCLNDLDLGDYLTTLPTDSKSENKWDGSACSDSGYDYVVVDGGYLLIAKLENASSSGDGIYLDTGLSVTAGDTAAENFTSNAAQLCSATSCDTGAIYVLGR